MCVKPVNQWRIGLGSPLKAQAFVQSEQHRPPQLSKIKEQKSEVYSYQRCVFIAAVF